MLYISIEDFRKQTKAIASLSREEELALAARMTAGDYTAREILLRGYLPQVAAVIDRMPREYQTLELALRCCAALERAADGFDFSQNSERFSHRLSWALRQTTTAYIADKHNTPSNANRPS